MRPPTAARRGQGDHRRGAAELCLLLRVGREDGLGARAARQPEVGPKKHAPHQPRRPMAILRSGRGGPGAAAGLARAAGGRALPAYGHGADARASRGVWSVGLGLAGLIFGLISYVDDVWRDWCLCQSEGQLTRRVCTEEEEEKKPQSGGLVMLVRGKSNRSVQPPDVVCRCVRVFVYAVEQIPLIAFFVITGGGFVFLYTRNIYY